VRFDIFEKSTICKKKRKRGEKRGAMSVFSLFLNTTGKRVFQTGCSGLYIRAGSRRSLPASLPGFAGYFHCFTSLNMSRRWTHHRPLFTKLRLLKNLKKTLLLIISAQCILWNRNLPNFCPLTDSFALSSL